MSDVSRIIRERALAILRDTRAKIDPALLAAMKERIAEIMPEAKDVPPAPPKKQPSLREEKFIPSLIMDEPVAVADMNEPVDKQKIAQIVLHYMKHKENGAKH